MGQLEDTADHRPSPRRWPWCSWRYRPGRHRRTSSPRAIRATRKSTPAGRPGPAPSTPRRPAASPPPVSSSNRPRPSARRLHPVHRQAHDHRPRRDRKTARGTENRPRRPPGRAQRQPRRDPALRPRRPSKPPPPPATRSRRSATSFVTAADPVLGAVAPQLQAAVYNIKPPNRASPPASGSNCSATKSSSRPTSTGPATTTRASRSHVPKALDLPGLGRRDPQKPPGLRRHRRRRHLHHHPQHLPRRGDPGGRPAALLDLPARRLLRGRGEPRLPVSRATPSPASSRRSRPAPRPKNAGRFPTTRRSPSTPAPRRPTRPPGRRSTSTFRTSSAAGNQDSSNTRTATVSLPVGMGLNPSAANGLQTCTDAQFGKDSAAPGTDCPAGLENRHGRRSNRRRCRKARSPATSTSASSSAATRPRGNEYRIFVDAESSRYGISVRLVGNVSADPVNRAADDHLRRQPAGAVHLLQARLRRRPAGGRSAARRPAARTRRRATMTPWSGNPAATPSAPSSSASAPGGGACAKTLAARPFAPGFAARPTRHQGRRLQPALAATSPAPTASRS